MPARKTQEAYEREIAERFSNEIELLGRYKNNTTKLLFHHKLCGHKWQSSPRNMEKGPGCPQCSSYPNRKSGETFTQQLVERFQGEIQTVEPYVNKRTRILFRHEACGHEWRTTPECVLRGDGCPKCTGRWQPTEEQFKAELFAKVGDEFSVLGKFELLTKQVLMRHNICGYQWMAWPGDFLSKNHRFGCWKCANAPKKTPDEFRVEVHDLVGNEYTVLGDFAGALKKIRMRHETCGYEWKVTPANFRQGNRCPKCNESKGERRISDFLQEHAIQLEREYWFADCRFKKPLRFDFAVFDEANSLYCLIEYDGKQHFKGWNGHSEPIEMLQKRDAVKNAYCQKKGIRLIRIPYTEFDNIERILENELSALLRNEKDQLAQ